MPDSFDVFDSSFFNPRNEIFPQSCSPRSPFLSLFDFSFAISLLLHSASLSSSEHNTFCCFVSTAMITDELEASGKWGRNMPGVFGWLCVAAVAELGSD